MAGLLPAGVRAGAALGCLVFLAGAAPVLANGRARKARSTPKEATVPIQCPEAGIEIAVTPKGAAALSGQKSLSHGSHRSPYTAVSCEIAELVLEEAGVLKEGEVPAEGVDLLASVAMTKGTHTYTNYYVDELTEFYVAFKVAYRCSEETGSQGEYVCVHRGRAANTVYYTGG